MSNTPGARGLAVRFLLGVVVVGGLALAVLSPVRGSDGDAGECERGAEMTDETGDRVDASGEGEASTAGETRLAMFGAGCFWGPEVKFRAKEGVVDALVGYSGGDVEEPTYRQVCFTDTGHAEVVRVEYDPERVSYRELVELFFEMHDPTQLNRQGPDVGEQYRSVIFTYDEEQARVAREVKDRLGSSDAYDREIVTAIEPAETFWKAEEYHQRYLEKRGLTSCSLPSR